MLKTPKISGSMEKLSTSKDSKPIFITRDPPINMTNILISGQIAYFPSGNQENPYVSTIE